MNRNMVLSISLWIAVAVIFAGCAPAASTPASEMQGEEAVLAEPPAEKAPESAPQDVSGEESVIYRAGGSENLTISTRAGRLLVKNAEIELLVEETDVAIDLATQIVEDVGGYIISSRVWYQDWGKESYKHATFTIGVPVDQFERTLRRLRGLAIKVLNENATGEDVTEEYVDLESQLENLEATRDRIRGFLDQAETVEEALEVNQELSKIEGQIEEVQGRMNYLSDRAAYSTITITMTPELAELPTPTPYPTSTPIPWEPAETLGNATRALRNIYMALIDIGIWLVVVILPVIAPPVLVGWAIWWWIKRRSKTANEGEEA